jgi:L-alanine-DL-glutamate epimerase-like enolase superfamily enzyme
MPLVPMKIVSIEVYPVRVPRKEVPNTGGGAAGVAYSEFGIIRIECEGGYTGLGEISITYPRIGFSLCHAARTLIVPALIGQNALEIPRILAIIDLILLGELSCCYLRAAFEMALLDLAGKRFSIPVYQLFGGKARESVPLARGIYQKAPEEMAEDARAIVAEGYHAIKVKVGRRIEDDQAAVRAIATAVGRQTPLRLDANMAWRTVPEALRAMRVLSSEATVAWFEQPLERHNLDGLRLLRAQSDAPIMADESVQTLFDAYQVARAQAADIWNVYVSEAGGLRAAANIFALAATLDIPCIIGSQVELGIGAAAIAHLAVTLPNLPYACEASGPLRYQRDIVQRTPRICGGFLYAPEGPGLGVEIDEVALRELTVAL